MRRVLLRILAAVVLFNVAMAVVGLVLRRLIPSRGDADSDELALAAVFNGIDLTSRAGAFRGGSILAVMGGVRLDLRGATLDPAGARLDIQTVMGGVQILVPESWHVERGPGASIMGGIDLPSANATIGEGPMLTITARSAMGGVQATARAAEPAKGSADGLSTVRHASPRT